MNLFRRIIDFFRRLFGWRPPEPPIEEPDPLPEQPEQPQEPVEPEPEPEVPTPDPEPLYGLVVRPLTDHPAWRVVTDPLTTDGHAFEATEPGDGDLTATAMVELAEGTYSLWARVNAPDLKGDRFYGGIQSHAIYRAVATQLARYHWVHVGTYPLSAGGHRVGVGTGEVGLRLDCLVLDPVGLTPAQLDELVGIPETPKPEPEIPTPEPEIPEPPIVEPVGFSDATHKVAPLVAAFDPQNPTLRTGQPLTAMQRHFYEAFTRAMLRPDPDEYTDTKGRLGRNDSYHLGRHGQVIQVSALLAMSRTGDGRILDLLTAGWNRAYANLVIEWDAGNLDRAYVEDDAGSRIVDGKWVLKDGKTPWSPYPKWLYAGNNGRAGAGTDQNALQNVKPWAILAQYLWALEVNRNAVSPEGLDYGREADKWRPVLKGLVEAFTIASSEPWVKNYRGLDGGIRLGGKLLYGGSRTRAKPGTWPFLVRDEGHAIYNSALLAYYCGLLGSRGWDLPAHELAIPAADDLMRYIRQEMVDSRDSNGKASIILKGGAAHSAMKATYVNYAALELAHIRDIGRWNDLFDASTLLRVSRSYADMIHPDGSTMKNLASEVDRTGHGLDVSLGSERTPYQNAINAFSTPLLWEEGDRLSTATTASQNKSPAGGYGDKAKTHILPAIQFVRSL